VALRLGRQKAGHQSAASPSDIAQNSPISKKFLDAPTRTKLARWALSGPEDMATGRVWQLRAESTRPAQISVYERLLVLFVRRSLRADAATCLTVRLRECMSLAAFLPILLDV
jgi:hypothetical protein